MVCFRANKRERAVFCVQIYITCSLKATTAAAAVDATNKACSFSNG